MSVSGIISGNLVGYKTKRTTRGISEKGFDNTTIKGTDDLIAKKRAGITQQASVMDIYNSMSRFAGSISKVEETKSISLQSKTTGDIVENGRYKYNNQESETKTDIIVKPDGSRVLVITMNIGGMETTMSLEISKPTDTLNETANQEVMDDKQSAISDSNLSENQVTGTSM